MTLAHPAATGALAVLVTAFEAYPAFENLFLNAEKSILLGFRIFDPLTKLHSDAARKVGDNWADLILATLNRGVDIDVTISDFDPIAGYDLHRGAWKTVRILHALAEISGDNAGGLKVTCLQHPAIGGIIPRLIFAPQTRKKLHTIADDINERPDEKQRFKFIPHLREPLKTPQGDAALRPWTLPRVFPVTLHLKMAVIDGTTTYIGGLDLNDRRYDDKNHDRPAQETWHDVQLIVRDTALARDAAAFLQTLPQTTAGTQPPAPISSGFRATLSRKRRPNIFALAPTTISDTLLKEHLIQISTARDLIYIETQYFRDRRIAKALVAAAKRSPNLKILLLLPAAPSDIAFHGSHSLDARFGEYLQARTIRQVRRAFGRRFFIVTPVQPRVLKPQDSDEDRATLNEAPIVYVHAKVAIFDEKTAIVGSANLNGRSLKWDVETGVVLSEPDQVKQLRNAVFGHWLPADADPSYFAPQSALQRWHALALSNAQKPAQDREGFVMPYDLEPAKALGLPIPGAPEELV